MMLMLLLTELTHLEMHLSVEADGLHVLAPAGVLTEELRQALTEHKAALLRYAAYPYVETIDGRGTLTGCRQEFSIIDLVAPQRKERLRYKVGVRLLHDGLERFYLPGTVWEVERQDDETLSNNSQAQAAT